MCVCVVCCVLYKLLYFHYENNKTIIFLFCLFDHFIVIFILCFLFCCCSQFFPPSPFSFPSQGSSNDYYFWNILLMESIMHPTENKLFFSFVVPCWMFDFSVLLLPIIASSHFQSLSIKIGNTFLLFHYLKAVHPTRKTNDNHIVEYSFFSNTVSSSVFRFFSNVSFHCCSFLLFFISTIELSIICYNSWICIKRNGPFVFLVQVLPLELIICTCQMTSSVWKHLNLHKELCQSLKSSLFASNDEYRFLYWLSSKKPNTNHRFSFAL